MTVPVESYLENNNKHPVAQLLDAINVVGAQKNKDWVKLQPTQVSNPIVFKQYQQGGLSIAPTKSFEYAKEINIDYSRMVLSDVRYRNEVTPVFYVKNKPIKWHIWQFNDLFHTALDPEDDSVSVEIVDGNLMKFNVINDNNLLYKRSSVSVPYVNITITLKEILESGELTLNKTSIDYAINLNGRKTDIRREQSLLLNPFDALGYAIGLRKFSKNAKSDGLTDYNYDQLPPFHKLTLSNGVRFHLLSGNYLVKQVSGEDYNTELKMHLSVDNVYQENDEANIATIRYNRQDIMSYVKSYLGVGEDVKVLKINVVKKPKSGEEANVALLQYLGLDTQATFDNVVNGRTYSIMESSNLSSGETSFNFNNAHPLFMGRLNVKFIVGD